MAELPKPVLSKSGFSKKGQVANGGIAIALDEGKKPRLFIREGHIHANAEYANDAARLYQEAQGAIQAATGDANRRFLC